MCENKCSQPELPITYTLEGTALIFYCVIQSNGKEPTILIGC